MNDDYGGPPPGGAVRRPTAQHLDTDALSALLDGRLDPESLTTARTHVAACADCRRELDELRTTVSLLRGLPQYRPRRSFVLGPAYAKPAHASRLARFLPFLPALRTATAVVALLLAVVTGADLLIDDEPAPATSTQLTTVEAGGPAVSAREPTGRDALSGAQGGSADQAAADEAEQLPAEEAEAETRADGEAPALDDAANVRPATEPAARGAMADSDRGASSGSMAEGEEAQAAPAEGDGADVAPVPDSVASASEPVLGGERSSAGRVTEDGLSGWQVAQIALGVTLAGLVVLLVALHRLAARARRLDPGF